MTIHRSALIIAVQTVVIVLLAWALVFYARDEWKFGADKDDESVKATSRTSLKEGRPLVKLSEQAQAASGIVTEPMKPVSAAPQYQAYGIVINLQPLIDLRSRYSAATSDATSARASLANTTAEYKRLTALLKDDRNVSERVVQAAEATWKSDQARLSAAEQLAANTLGSMRNQWGSTLSGWAMEQESGMFARLMKRDDVIVQIAMSNNPTSVGSIKVAIVPAESNAKPRPAQFVSASPQADTALQGQTFFYKAPGDGLRIGMRVTAQVRTEGATLKGVAVPLRAVVWYAGKAWVYVMSGGEEFSRYEVNPQQEAGDYWIVTNGLSAGDKVVVGGAQLLLSEEQKYQLKTDD